MKADEKKRMKLIADYKSKAEVSRACSSVSESFRRGQRIGSGKESFGHRRCKAVEEDRMRGTERRKASKNEGHGGIE